MDVQLKTLGKKQHVNRHVPSISNSCNIPEPYPLHLNTGIQV